VAATPIATQQFGVEALGDMNVSDLGAGTAADATNGNSTPNNGSLVLFILGTATDTVTVTRPEEATADAAPIAVTANHLEVAGPFELDLYGATLAYKAGATTTKIWPVQIADLS
jgi:hypothetical protein